MGQVFTVYCCGTNFHRGSNDVVARLYARTPADDGYINDGPGGGNWTPNAFGGRSNPGGASKLGGLLFGVGVDANVEGTVRMLAGVKPLPRVVNLCGWSRGAVTCAKIANTMHRMGAPLSHVAVNIFAIDPVPGSNLGSGHMWKNIEITPNVRFYTAILSQHDTRGVDDFFQPTYPAAGGSTKVEVDVMPGSHSSIVVFKGQGPEDTAELVEDLAKRFLTSHGTRFSGATPLFGETEILSRYARIQENFVYYTRLKGNIPADLSTLGRAIRDVNKNKVGTLSMGKPRFFINEHHRETLRMGYPYLVSEIDRDPPSERFGMATFSGWNGEVDKLMKSCPEQARVLFAYAYASRGG